MALVKFGRSRDIFPALPGLMDTLLGSDLFDTSNSSSTGTSLPAINIIENKDEFKVEVAAPGLTKEDFKIKLENNLLVIASEKEESREEGEKDSHFSRREFSYQSFQRTMTLPTGVEAEKISASYKDGILSVVIPKKEEAKVKPARMIEIL